MKARLKISSVPAFKGAIWPDARQELLLKSALLPAPEAHAAWTEWRKHAAFEVIDAGSTRLLPLVWHNLGELLSEEDKNICKGAYKKSWYRNQKLFQIASDFLVLFREHGIESIIFKGGALTVLYYKDLGLRPMNDFDILVPRGRAEEAGRLLESKGWKITVGRPLHRHMEIKHSGEYSKGGGTSIDLHWYLLDTSRGMWDPFAHADRLIPVQIGNFTGKTLDAESNLLHTCVHGFWWSPVPTFRWITDAILILRSHPDFDWETFCEDARSQRLLLIAWEAAAYLRKLWPDKIPENVVLKLHQMVQNEVSEAELRMHELGKNRPLARGAIHDLWKDHVWSLWSKSKNKEISIPLTHKLVTLPDFLKNYWNLGSSRQIPGVILRKILCRPANLLPWPVPLEDKKSGKSSPHDRQPPEENHQA